MRNGRHSGRDFRKFGSRTAVNMTGSQIERERAANQPPGSSPCWPNASSPSFGVAAPYAARLPQVRQRSLAGTRTDASAPRTTGQKHDRVSIRPGRCLKVFRNPLRVSYSSTTAQGPTRYPNLPLPIILSATVLTHRQILPGLPLGGRCWSNEIALCRTIPPVQPNPLYRRVRLSPRGCRLGQKMTGAAIQDRWPRER
jgi:hypothetical protein